MAHLSEMKMLCFDTDCDSENLIWKWKIVVGILQMAADVK